MRLYVDYFEEEKSLSSYGSKEELITEALHLLDLLLESYLDKKGGYPENGVLSRGLVVTDAEIRSYLETPAFLRETEETDPLLSDQVRLARSHMDQRVKLTKEHAPDICTALWDVRTRFSLSEFEYLCVLLAFAIQYDLKYTRLFVYLQDDITKKCPQSALRWRSTGCTKTQSPTYRSDYLSRKERWSPSSLKNMRQRTCRRDFPYRSSCENRC